MLDDLPGNIVGDDPPSPLAAARTFGVRFLLDRFFDQLFQFADFKEKQLVRIDPFPLFTPQRFEQLQDLLFPGFQFLLLLEQLPLSSVVSNAFFPPVAGFRLTVTQPEPRVTQLGGKVALCQPQGKTAS